MKWLSNFSLIMRSNLTTLCEKCEDPERMLHQLLIDMESELGRVRESVAGAIADEIQLGRKVQQADEEAETWNERATTAIKRNDEKAAKAALEQKVFAEQRAEDLRVEHEKQRQETAKLRNSVQDLENRIRQARQRQTLLLARLARADSSKRINGALDRVGNQSAFSQFNRLEQRAERAEVMNEAYDRLDGKDPGAEDLEREFAEADRQERIEKELQELRDRVRKDDQ